MSLIVAKPQGFATDLVGPPGGFLDDFKPSPKCKVNADNHPPFGRWICLFRCLNHRCLDDCSVNPHQPRLVASALLTTLKGVASKYGPLPSPCGSSFFIIFQEHDNLVGSSFETNPNQLLNHPPAFRHRLGLRISIFSAAGSLHRAG